MFNEGGTAEQFTEEEGEINQQGDTSEEGEDELDEYDEYGKFRKE